MNKNSSEPKAHSKWGPSSSERWMNCPGSVALCDTLPPSEDTEYSALGTGAHEVGAKALLEQKSALDYMGMTFNGFKCDAEMAEAVQVYVDACRARFPAGLEFSWALNRVIFIEQRFNLSWLIPEQFGTSDCTIYNSGLKKLHVLDYKNGFTPVHPEWNSQAMMYALGALHFLWSLQTEVTKKVFSVLQLVDTVELVIVQPNGFSNVDPVKTWEISAADLIYWGVHVLKSAYAATLQKEARLSAGDHCKFCPAFKACPEVASTAMELAKTDFKDPVFPDPSQLTPTEIVKLLSFSELFKSWTNEVAAYAQRQMENGTKLPGYKLVKRSGDRAWKDELEAAQFLEQTLGENAYEKKLRSVAKAEAAAKLIGLDKKQLEPYWHKPDIGIAMAPVTDKRPEVAAPGVMEFLEDADWAK